MGTFASSSLNKTFKEVYSEFLLENLYIVYSDSILLEVLRENNYIYKGIF